MSRRRRSNRSGRLDLVLDHVGGAQPQWHRGGGPSVPPPGPGTTTEPVRYSGDLVVLEHLRERRRGYRPPAPHREHEPVAVAERPRRVEDLQRPDAERDPVLALRLHPCGRDRPHRACRVDFVPRRSPAASSDWSPARQRPIRALAGMDGNRLYFGDNLDILRRHVADGTVDLVYLDPPFKSNQDYNVLFAERDGARAAAQIKAF